MNHYKDPVFKQPIFHGTYPAGFFFVAHLITQRGKFENQIRKLPGFGSKRTEEQLLHYLKVVFFCLSSRGVGGPGFPQK